MDVVRPSPKPTVITGKIIVESKLPGAKLPGVGELKSDPMKGTSENTSGKKPIDASKEEDEEKIDVVSASKFWKSVFDVFSRNGFQDEDMPVIELVDPKDQYKAPKGKPKNSRKSLLSKSKIKDLELLTAIHKKVYTQLPDELPTSVYKPDSKGIVTIGGGFYSWLAAIQVLQLRKIGSMLPIEVVLPTLKDYERESQFCVDFLPKHNAKCVIVEEVFGADIVDKIGSYQFKAAGLAVSSFQHTLLLDSDNNPVVAPDRLFEAKVYKANGMILWPDYWPRTMSPQWHDIIGKPYSMKEKIRNGRYPLVNIKQLTPEEGEETSFGDLKGTLADLSTESGQVMINKATHGKVTLMILYYNLFGPSLYYKLFSLGALGEGDKDTFATAAFACDKPYYQVKSHIKTYGYHGDGSYHGMTMAQKDPEEDYQTYIKTEKEYREKGVDWDKEATDRFGGDNDIPVFTLHCNINKIDPFLYLDDEKISDLTKNRLKQRFYSNFKMKLPGDGTSPAKILDFELTRWESAEEILCNKKIKFSISKDKKIEPACEYIRNTIAWLKDDKK
ncbi:Alpha-12-mannosyltransferase MNN22 [Spathaspora sp. JA1]|nr:Alpha-12-mannosyltransferase MNN22 [Spathaspora sp. JA1]